MAISRREFIYVSGIALATCTTGAALGCSAPSQTQNTSANDGQPESSQASTGAGSAPKAEGSSAADAGQESLQENGTHANTSEAESANTMQGAAIAAGALVVTEYAGNSIAICDPEAFQVVERISTGPNPAFLAYANDCIYATISGGGVVLQVPIANMSKTREIQTGTQPLAICADEQGNRVFVADYFSSAISVVDASLASVVDSIQMDRVGFRNRTDPPSCCQIQPGVGRRPTYIMPAPEDGRIYTFNYGTYDISTIEVSTGNEVDIFDGVVGPRRAALSQDAAYLLVAGVGGDEEEKVSELYVVDRLSGKRIEKVSVGVGVAGVVVDPESGRAFAIARDDGLLVSIDQASWEVAGTCSLSAGIDSLALSSNGSRVFVGNSLLGEVAVVDAKTLEVLGTISGLVGPKDMLVVPEVSQ